MKIIDERKKENTCFDNVSIGDCFLCNDKVYMRIINVYTSDSIDGLFNAVELETGYLSMFRIDIKVSKVDAAIVLGCDISR